MSQKRNVKTSGKSVASLPKGVNLTGPKTAHGNAKGKMNTKGSTNKAC